MLDHVDVGPRSLSAYEHIVGEEVIQEIQELATTLKGASVAHINATTYGGGVSELLRSMVPLYRGLGIYCDWKIISGDPQFFGITKGMHNALQGASYELTRAARDTYLMHTTRNAQLLEEEYDYIIVHDPQPAAIRYFRGRAGAQWIWRCHIDTSEPNKEVMQFLWPFLEEYDALVFTLERFVPPGLGDHRISIMPPAIDPLSPKNMRLTRGICQEIRSWRGIDPNRKLVSQISRFDPWKDPLGVIDVYRMVRPEVPGLQLALLSSMASDDPEVWEIYDQVTAETLADDDIHVLTNLIGVGDIEVNAFQLCSDVVLQKSIREGFGLVVSETLWKGTPVVANRSGGIPLQMGDGVGGFLVDNTEECAEKTLYLLKHPDEARALGVSGREKVREEFLITRLLADELRLLASL